MHLDISTIINSILGVGVVAVGGLLIWSFKRDSQQSEDIAVLKAISATKESVSALEEKSKGHGHEISELKQTTSLVSEMKGELGQVKERVDMIYNHIVKNRGQVV